LIISRHTKDKCYNRHIIEIECVQFAILGTTYLNHIKIIVLEFACY